MLLTCQACLSCLAPSDSARIGPEYEENPSSVLGAPPAAAVGGAGPALLTLTGKNENEVNHVSARVWGLVPSTSTFRTLPRNLVVSYPSGPAGDASKSGFSSSRLVVDSIEARIHSNVFSHARSVSISVRRLGIKPDRRRRLDRPDQGTEAGLVSPLPCQEQDGLQDMQGTQNKGKF
ncbi:hypothetical protein ARSEF1564_007878, partial [Beauveria bassiana]